MDTKCIRDLSAEFAAHLSRLYVERSRARRFRGSTAAEFEAWQAQARAELTALMGGQPAQVPPLELERIPLDPPDDPAFSGLRLERLYYRTREDLTATAYLVLPENMGGAAPAVLCPPGHGGGMNQLVFERQGIYHQYPLALARRGMAALVPEHIGFGERAGAPYHHGYSHEYYYLAPLMLGENAMGYLLWDMRRALDVLESLPEVDSSRIGCYGLSLGGEITMHTAAVDMRIRAACSSGFFTSYKSTFLREKHCGCGYVPGLVNIMEHADIAALIAPRSLLIENGAKDPSFRAEIAAESFDELREVYALCGAADRLALHIFEGEHEISGAESFGWLARRLQS